MARMGFVAILVIGVLLAATVTRAQDGPELEQRVEALETRVAALESTPIAVRAVGSDNALTFHGSGEVVSEPFYLPDGNVILTVESTDRVNVRVHPWPGSGIIGVLTTPRGEPGLASTVIGTWDGGDHVLAVASDAEWTVTIELP